MSMPDLRPPYRIGVVLLPRKGLNEAALRFLVLSMNTRQKVFQFEFYPPNPDDELVKILDSRREVSHAAVRRHLPKFADRMHDYLAGWVADYELTEDPPRRFVVISHCCLDDNYYSTGQDDSSVIAMGHWKRFMAPPSLLEFVQSLLVDEAVSLLCPSLRAGHLGNKGCVLDFNALLSEVRHKALQGYVCHFCRSRMAADGHPELPSAVSRLLDRTWLGSSTDPRSPAGIAANLGYNLFIAKGARATPAEAFISAFRTEGAKQIVAVLGGIVLAVITFVLGLKVGH